MINEFKEKGYIKSKEELPAEMLSHGLGIKVKDVIDIIHECGGKAIWAHPYIVRTYTDLRIDVQTNEEVEEYLRILLPLGIDGLEARYHHFTDKQRDFLLSLCGKYCLMHTVGTDFHGKDAASSNILCEEVEDLECDRIIKNFK
jgi:predicted metal-dependent phosphoesterase TrpH